MDNQDSILGEFYLAVLDERPWPHIPRSEVYYVRAAIEADTGIRYSLDRIERSMYLEGMIPKADVFEPERKRPWE